VRALGFHPMRAFVAGLVWLALSVGLGLVFAVGGAAIVAFTTGIPISREGLTAHGELLPGAATLCVGGVLSLVRKPANTISGERETFAVLCLVLAAVAALWWGSILTLYQEGLGAKVARAGVANGTLAVYVVAAFVGGWAVVRSERR
jgi:hypothetical protein